MDYNTIRHIDRCHCTDPIKLVPTYIQMDAVITKAYTKVNVLDIPGVQCPICGLKSFSNRSYALIKGYNPMYQNFLLPLGKGELVQWTDFLRIVYNLY